MKQVIAETYERNAVVGAVCHGPVSLLNVKLSDGRYLVDDKNIASFTTAEEDNYARPDVPFDLQTALTNQSAIFHAAAPWSAKGVAEKRPSCFLGYEASNSGWLGRYFKRRSVAFPSRAP